MNIISPKIVFVVVVQATVFQYLGCASSRTAVSEISPINKSLSPTPDRDDTINDTKKISPELEKNKRLWQEKNIVDYDLNASLFKPGSSILPEPVLIKVRNGELASIDVLNEKFKQLPVEEYIREYRELGTIEKMFDEIQKALDAKAYVKVKYDEIYGYPKDVGISYFKGIGTDHGRTMIINKFEVINE